VLNPNEVDAKTCGVVRGWGLPGKIHAVSSLSLAKSRRVGWGTSALTHGRSPTLESVRHAALV
jgi:hypothetical protein